MKPFSSETNFPANMDVLVQDGPLQSRQQGQARPCAHCGLPVETPFCSSCGQRKDVASISWSSLLHELGTHWLGLDNQFARTFLGLTLRPGKVVRAYLAGDRIRYLGPVGYYIIITAVVLLLLSFLNISMEDFLVSNNQSLGVGTAQTGRVAELQARILHYMAGAFRFVAILMLPFLALSLKWLYRSKGFNFLEFCTLVLYAVAHMFWLSLLQGIVFKFNGRVHTGYSFLIALPYYGFLTMDTLEERKSLLKFMKAMGAYLLGIFLFVFSILMFSLLLGLMLGLAMGYAQ